MAIYYKDIIATLEFEGEENLQLENQFDKDTPPSLSKIHLTIIVRDIKQGRSGKDSPHRNNPSIKIFNCVTQELSYPLSPEMLFHSLNLSIFEVRVPTLVITPSDITRKAL